MKFRYLGKEETMTAFGYDFSDGQTPDVTNENAIKRLSGNSFFKAVEGEPESEPEPVKTKKSKAATFDGPLETIEGPITVDADADFPALPGKKK